MIVDVVTGSRGTVNLLEIPDWGRCWECLTCGRSAGAPNSSGPFQDAKLPSGREVTAEEQWRRSATQHATEICTR